jgi:hypothetical protein
VDLHYSGVRESRPCGEVAQLMKYWPAEGAQPVCYPYGKEELMGC